MVEFANKHRVVHGEYPMEQQYRHDEKLWHVKTAVPICSAQAWCPALRNKQFSIYCLDETCMNFLAFYIHDSECYVIEADYDDLVNFSMENPHFKNLAELIENGGV